MVINPQLININQMNVILSKKKLYDIFGGERKNK